MKLFGLLLRPALAKESKMTRTALESTPYSGARANHRRNHSSGFAMTLQGKLSSFAVPTTIQSPIPTGGREFRIGKLSRAMRRGGQEKSGANLRQVMDLQPSKN